MIVVTLKTAAGQNTAGHGFARVRDRLENPGKGQIKDTRSRQPRRTDELEDIEGFRLKRET